MLSDPVTTLHGMELIDAPTYSKIRVQDLGSTDGIEGVDVSVGDVVLLWTLPVNDENPFVSVRIQGVVDDDAHLSWLPDDATVDVVEETRYAGMPQDLVTAATPVQTPAGSRGIVKTEEGWHELIWNNSSLHAALVGWTDAQIATAEILCALTFAPDSADLRPMLLAGLKAQFAKVARTPGVNPPAMYPWHNGTTLDPEDLKFYRGRY